MKLQRNKNHFWLWAVCAALVLATAIGAYNSDVLRMEWQGEELTLAEGGGYGQLERSRYTYEELQPAGPFTDGPGVSLQKGTYRLIVQYSSTGGDNSLDVYSDQTQNDAGGSEQVFAEAVLPADQTVAELTFTLPADARNVQFRTYYGGSGIFTLNKVYLRSAGLYYYDGVFTAAAELLLMAACGWWLRRGSALRAALETRRETRILVLFFAGLAVFVNYPLFMDFLPWGHDLGFHLMRLEGMKEAMLGGQFPVRIAAAAFNGGGYASSTMYPELFLYPFALLRLLGMSLMGAYKWMVACLNIATMLVAYWAGVRLFRSRWAGLVTSVLYTLSTYRLANVYLRTAVGEAIAMIFWPVLAVGLYEVFFGEKRAWPLLVAAYCGLAQSHLISIELAAVFSVVFGLLFLRRLIREPARILALVKACVLTVLLNLWFLVPLFELTGYGLNIFNARPEMEKHAAYLVQVFMNWWPLTNQQLLSLPQGSISYEMPLSLGLTALLGAGAFLAGRVWKGGLLTSEEMRRTRMVRVMLFFAAFSVYAATIYFPWGVVEKVGTLYKLCKAVQFPWRFLSLAAPLLALAGGAAVLWLPGRRQRSAAAVGIVALACLTGGYTMDVTLQQAAFFEKYDVIDNNSGQYGEYLLTTAVDSKLSHAPYAGDYGTAQVSGYQKRGATITFSYTAEQNTEAEVPLTFYPGYEVKIDGQKAETQMGPTSRLQFALPAGSGAVEVRYAGFAAGNVATAVSAATLLAVCAFALLKKRRARPNADKPQEVSA